MMSAIVINGREIASGIEEEIKSEILTMKEHGYREPCLAVVLVGDDPASKIYVGGKQKACLKVGVKSHIFHLDETISQEQLTQKLNYLNELDAIDGILLQLPLPNHLDKTEAIATIAHEKDVDGLTVVSQGKLNLGLPGLYPCTSLGIMELLRVAGPVDGKLAVVIGQSVLVGAPTSTLLRQNGATVIGIHDKTQNAPALSGQANIVIAAAGVMNLVDEKWVKPGAIVIDVGIHRNNNKLVGDVDFKAVSKIAGYITPVPGGVGPMTITMLLKNCLTAFKNRQVHQFNSPLRQSA